MINIASESMVSFDRWDLNLQAAWVNYLRLTRVAAFHRQTQTPAEQKKHGAYRGNIEQHARLRRSVHDGCAEVGMTLIVVLHTDVVLTLSAESGPVVDGVSAAALMCHAW